MKKVIFLDIDGVVNTIILSNKYKPIMYNKENKQFPNKQATILIGKLCEEENADIVITSTWRIGHNIEELRQVFYNSGLSSKVNIIDFTPITKDLWRETEIKLWLSNHNQYKEFIIIDDDSYDLQEYKDKLVQTNTYDGFTFSKYLEAKELFEKLNSAIL